MLQIHRGSTRSLGIVRRVRECQPALPCGFRHSDSPGSRTRPAGHGPHRPISQASLSGILPANSAIIGNATEGALFIYTHSKPRFPAPVLQTMPHSVMPLKGHAFFVDTLQSMAFRHLFSKLCHNRLCHRKDTLYTYTLQSIAFWHLPPNSAIIGYVTEGALLIRNTEHRFPASFLQTLPELVMPLKGHSLYTHYRARFPAPFLPTLPELVTQISKHGA